jgi:protein-S-isoprenylcysteine O-methyltransferase Ste14
LPRIGAAIGGMLLYVLVWGLMTRRWSAAARDARARAASVHPLLSVPVPFVFVLAYLAGLGLQLLTPLTIDQASVSRIANWIGFVLLGIGLVIALSALTLFKRSTTTTVPFETPSQLVVRGPYRFTRNPMYLGLAIAYLGVAAVQGQLWSAIILPVVLVYINWVVIPVEERRLYDTFGEAYARYRARVRRWL